MQCGLFHIIIPTMQGTMDAVRRRIDLKRVRGCLQRANAKPRIALRPGWCDRRAHKLENSLTVVAMILSFDKSVMQSLPLGHRRRRIGHFVPVGIARDCVMHAHYHVSQRTEFATEVQ